MRRLIITAALAAALMAGGCAARKKAEGESFARREGIKVERISADSLVVGLAAMVDSPEIIVTRLDSPRVRVEIRARRVETKTTARRQSAGHLVARAEETEEGNKSSRSSREPAAPWRWWIILLLGLGAWLIFKKKS